MGRVPSMSRSVQQAAENEATFRLANDGLEQKADELELSNERTPYPCECEDERCTRVIQLRREEYEQVRKYPAEVRDGPGPSGGRRARRSGGGRLHRRREGPARRASSFPGRTPARRAPEAQAMCRNSPFRTTKRAMKQFPIRGPRRRASEWLIPAERASAARIGPP